MVIKFICRTNTQTALRYIYVLSPGAILAHVIIKAYDWCNQGMSYVFLPIQTGHGWVSDEYDYTPPASFGILVVSF